MKKKILSALLTVTMVASLVGCGGGGTTSNSQAAGGDFTNFSGDVLVWCAENARDLTTAQVAEFNKANGLNGKVNVTVNPVSESDVSDKMSTDVSKGADLFFLPQDQLAVLRNLNAISSIGGQYKTSIEANNGADAVKASKLGDTIYGFPVTADNGYLLYYDGTKFNENDVKKWETMLEKAKSGSFTVDFNYNNAFYNFGFFYACGCDSVWTTDTRGAYTDVVDNFKSDKGINALKVMSNLFRDSAVVSPNNSAGTMSPKCAALVSGTWDYEAMVKKWGDNLKCAALPSFTLNGQDVHTGAFYGYKFIGIKPQNQGQELKTRYLYALADYLTGEAAQTKRFEKLKWGPSNTNVDNSEAVKAAPQLNALKAQKAYSKLQGQFPKKWWTFAGGLPKDAIDLGPNATDTQYENLLKTYDSQIKNLLNTDGTGED